MSNLYCPNRMRNVNLFGIWVFDREISECSTFQSKIASDISTINIWKVLIYNPNIILFDIEVVFGQRLQSSCSSLFKTIVQFSLVEFWISVDIDLSFLILLCKRYHYDFCFFLWSFIFLELHLFGPGHSFRSSTIFFLQSILLKVTLLSICSSPNSNTIFLTCKGLKHDCITMYFTEVHQKERPACFVHQRYTLRSRLRCCELKKYS